MSRVGGKKANFCGFLIRQWPAAAAADGVGGGLGEGGVRGKRSEKG